MSPMLDLSESVATIVAAVIGGFLGAIVAPIVSHRLSLEADRRADNLAEAREFRIVQRQLLFEIQDILTQLISDIVSIQATGRVVGNEPSEQSARESVTESPSSEAAPDPIEEQTSASIPQQISEDLSAAMKDLQSVDKLMESMRVKNAILVDNIHPKTMRLHYLSERLVSDDLRTSVSRLRSLADGIAKYYVDYETGRPPGLDSFINERQTFNDDVRRLYLGGEAPKYSSGWRKRAKAPIMASRRR